MQPTWLEQQFVKKKKKNIKLHTEFIQNDKYGKKINCY